MQDLAQKLRRILGENGWLQGELAATYERDWLSRYGEKPLGVARPCCREEIVAVVDACRHAGVPLVVQGGNTGLCGGAVCGSKDEVIVSLSRMNRIGPVDVDSGTVEVEAGVVLARLQAQLLDQDRVFPLHLGSAGTAQIGGLIATNAGGSHAFQHGTMQDLILGLEVVLPDGQVWNGLRFVQKDNAGYPLRRLFCGAEGTLGIVTRAVLRTFPVPRHSTTALVALADLETLVSFSTLLRSHCAEFLTGLEFFCDLGLELALKHIGGLCWPLGTRAPWYLLVELETVSPRVPLNEILEEILGRALECGQVLDASIANSESQRAALWRLREEQPEGQRREGLQLKHDIAVPPGRLAEFVANACEICEQLVPGVRINPFGHAGDGNVHFNLSAPEGQDSFASRSNRIATELGKLAQGLGGSFAAEHGLGRSKVGLADALRDSVERRLMRRLKDALDPDQLFNRNVVVRNGVDGGR